MDIPNELGAGVSRGIHLWKQVFRQFKDEFIDMSDTHSRQPSKMYPRIQSHADKVVVLGVFAYSFEKSFLEGLLFFIIPNRCFLGQPIQPNP